MTNDWNPKKRVRRRRRHFFFPQKMQAPVTTPQALARACFPFPFPFPD